MANKVVPPLTGAAWARVILYIALVVVALALGLAPTFGLTGMEGVLQGVLVVLGVLTGGTATLNVPKATDQKLPDLRELLPAVMNLANEVKDAKEVVREKPAVYPSLGVGPPHFDRTE